MHSLMLVISDIKPTEILLDEWLKPFMPEKFDWFTLGGRYTGLLIPFDLADTVTGGDDCSDIELFMDTVIKEASGGKVKMISPGARGPGVDALQVKNTKKVLLDGPPAIILKNGELFEDDDEDSNAASIIVGCANAIRSVYPEKADEMLASITPKQKAACDKWDAKARKLLRDVRPDQWTSIIDCHR
jgi:hypothetical protein